MRVPQARARSPRGLRRAAEVRHRGPGPFAAAGLVADRGARVAGVAPGARAIVMAGLVAAGAAGCSAPDPASIGAPPTSPTAAPAAAAAAAPGTAAPGGVPRAAFEAAGRRLVIEVLADDLVHFELAAADRPFSAARPLFTSPMIAPGPPARGPRRLTRRGARITTADLALDVGADLCVDVSRAGGGHLGRICPAAPSQGTRLSIAAEPGASAYGLGEKCVAAGLTGGDWRGRLRAPATALGNKMVPFDGGACGDAQFPVLYAVGPGPTPRAFALFVDDVRAQTWDLRWRPWSVATPSPELRWYVMAGDTPLDLRADYMALTGRPPVPPRAAFGLWVSEYGFEDWRELEGVLAGLRRRRFPVDGFVLDLQWFGGIAQDSPVTSMGKLAFDTDHFPDPAGKLAELRDRHGVGIILIEEPFVGRDLPEHARMAGRGFLARQPGGPPILLAASPQWWGVGGMIDWTNPAGADFWHDWKRRPLVELGVVGHWTDLGEPEAFDPTARYHGFAGIGTDQAAIHNLYNLSWAASIARGYRRDGSPRRPFILSRSGTSGIQRHGAAMWSGDLGARFTTLAAQQRNQLHMSMSGVDYYGSDVGGFWRHAIDPGDDEDELYSEWLADSAMTDVPVRPHTFNIGNRFHTSPDRIGDRASNLASVRLRYALIPYLYSLAHRAHRAGEPVFPPLFLHFPGDARARGIGDQKMIGPSLMVALVSRPHQRSRAVYLPAGTWFDFHTGARHESRGEWLERVPLRPRGALRLPLYARAGAIIPMQWVDGETMNAAGRRLDGSRRDELRARVFASAGPSSFTLVEDDGETTAYLRGEVRETTLRQRAGAGGALAEIEIGGARGTYRGAAPARSLALEVIGLERPPRSVLLDGRALSRRASAAALARAPDGWATDGDEVLVAAPAAGATRARRVRLLP
ncbi:MAG TPA: TIM-barrel domain-containing protein [Kofleriaceae bacterium]|nr:TIM-barrel domain-containing protein [Kofleriaceae bacterium]